MLDTVGPESHEPTSQWEIAKRAKTCKDHRFQDLYWMLDADLLLECWKELNKSSASGVDEVTAADYGQELIGNILNLAKRLKAKQYRTKLVSNSQCIAEIGNAERHGGQEKRFVTEFYPRSFRARR